MKRGYIGSSHKGKTPRIISLSSSCKTREKAKNFKFN